MVFVPSEDSDQPGHPPSLISLRCLHEETLGSQLPIERTAKTDKTGQLPRLIWVFAGRKCHFVGFVTRGLINEMQQDWLLHLRWLQLKIECKYKLSRIIDLGNCSELVIVVNAAKFDRESILLFNLSLSLFFAEYNFTFVPLFTRFHWSNNAHIKIKPIISKVNEYLTFVFPVVLQHVNTSTLSDVNSKRFSCL